MHKSVEQQVEEILDISKKYGIGLMAKKKITELLIDDREERDRIAEQRTIEGLRKSIDDEAASCAKKIEQAREEERERISAINEENIKDLVDGVYGDFPAKDKVVIAYNRIKALTIPLDKE